MARYRVRNWKDYNKSLIQRGSLDFWIEESVLKKWNAYRNRGSNGRPQIYSDDAIYLLLSLKILYHLSYRALQGFVSSIFRRESIPLSLPSYSQVCRRAQNLPPQGLSKRRPRAIIIDSTGMKIYGAGEWHTRQHRLTKRRTWRKLHIAICAQTQELVALEMTKANVSDDQVVPTLVTRIPKTTCEVLADGAYDTKECHRILHANGCRGIIPPRKSGAYDHTPDPSWRFRNDAVLTIQALGNDEVARSLWKKVHRYHRRSLVETAMYRLKRLTGDRLFSRLPSSQRTEMFTKALIINKMCHLGLPDSSWI